jgi:hypothetical protein
VTLFPVSNLASAFYELVIVGRQIVLESVEHLVDSDRQEAGVRVRRVRVATRSRP